MPDSITDVQKAKLAAKYGGSTKHVQDWLVQDYWPAQGFPTGPPAGDAKRTFYTTELTRLGQSTSGLSTMALERLYWDTQDLYATPTFGDTFESGGTTNWVTVTDNVAITAGAAKNGSFGAAFTPNSAAVKAANLATSTTKWTQATFPYWSCSVWFRINSRTTNQSTELVTVRNDIGVNHFDLFVGSASNKFECDLTNGAGLTATTSPVIGQWYRFQAKGFFGATTYTASAMFDGVLLGNISNAGQASGFTRSFHLGTSATNLTYNVDMDDARIQVGTTDPGWLT